ncbi:MAG: glycosyl transferase family 1 [Thermosipho sp. (in: Bacteria)]|nr:glycosyl transferase family 1 [Thermosipho sp. (in: thermotogales)]
MKVFILGYTHSKNDKRVFRTVETLSKRHKIIYQYWTDKDERSYTENNVTYIPIKYTKNLQTNYLVKLKNRKDLDEKILKMVEVFDYDAIYFHHFLPTKPLKPFKIAKKRGKMIIYDIHEYHPENFLNFFKGIAKVLKEKIMWNIFKKQLELSDKLIFVSKEIQEEIFKITGIDKAYMVIPNYASISISSKNKKKEISFVGKTDRNFESEKEILKELINLGFSFKIIGMDSKVFKGVPHEYTSFLPYKDMMKELSKSAFSLISYLPFGTDIKNYVYSLPHKFFDSIAAGTPVIVKNSFISMAKEVKKYGIGVVINPSNVEESVKKILDAYENYNVIQENIKKYKHLFIWNEEKEKEFVDFVVQ